MFPIANCVSLIILRDIEFESLELHGKKLTALKVEKTQMKHFGSRKHIPGSCFPSMLF